MSTALITLMPIGCINERILLDSLPPPGAYGREGKTLVEGVFAVMVASHRLRKAPVIVGNRCTKLAS